MDFVMIPAMFVLRSLGWGPRNQDPTSLSIGSMEKHFDSATDPVLISLFLCMCVFIQKPDRIVHLHPPVCCIHLRQDLTVNPQFTISAKLAGHWALNICLSLSHSAGLQAHTASVAFAWVLGIWTLIFLLTCKCSYLLVHFPSPSFSF